MEPYIHAWKAQIGGIGAQGLQAGVSFEQRIKENAKEESEYSK